MTLKDTLLTLKSFCSSRVEFGSCGALVFATPGQAIPDLVKIATSNDALLQELAAKATLKLSGDFTVAAEFLETGDEILVSITLAELIKNEKESSSAEFVESSLE